MRLTAQIEHLKYWTARYSKRHETSVPTGCPHCGLELWRESAEWDIN